MNGCRAATKIFEPGKWVAKWKRSGMAGVNKPKASDFFGFIVVCECCHISHCSWQLFICHHGGDHIISHQSGFSFSVSLRVCCYHAFHVTLFCCHFLISLLSHPSLSNAESHPSFFRLWFRWHLPRVAVNAHCRLGRWDMVKPPSLLLPLPSQHHACSSHSMCWMNAVLLFKGKTTFQKR